jgi:ElaB/YqjD/DUF883 family membrane-anchored ribosome-binding protein
VRLSRLILLIALLGGVLAASACGEGAQQAVDQARSRAQDALDRAGLGDDLDRAQAQVDDLVGDAAGAGADAARARAERAVREARARVERELRQARREGLSDAEVARLRREARARLADLQDRVDEAFGP